MGSAYGPLITPLIAVIGILAHVRRLPRPRDRARVVEVCLLWFFGVVVGLGGLFIAGSHVFTAAAIAHQIGFPAGNPFQFEVAMANLSYAVIGLLCLRWRGPFWNATMIGFAVFYWGASYGHLDQYLFHGNDAPYNAGPILYTDIGLPLVGIGLLIALHRLQHRSPARVVAAREAVRHAADVSS